MSTITNAAVYAGSKRLNSRQNTHALFSPIDLAYRIAQPSALLLTSSPSHIHLAGGRRNRARTDICFTLVHNSVAPNCTRA